MPSTYGFGADSTGMPVMDRAAFFTDPNLRALIDSALACNQELQILLQEIELARNETRARKGEYLPKLGLQAASAVEKVGEFTRNGAVERELTIADGARFPEPLPDQQFGFRASWEVDIWKRLRNARKAANLRYLATVEGRNFMMTNLVAEVASCYYELLALDAQLEILRNSVALQQDALEIMRLEKIAARVTELAVRRFEAEVFRARSDQFNIQQRIIATENHLNLLLGRFPGPITRDPSAFDSALTDPMAMAPPAQLLADRPDIRRAELELAAAKLDVRSARALFYPALGVTAGFGFNAFEPGRLFTSPASLAFGIAGDLLVPLVNRNAIKAQYASAGARQMQAVHAYERTLRTACLEVLSERSGLNNLRSSYDLRKQQVEALSSSVTLSSTLFRSARADYMEVLLTQREALDSKFELVETRKRQFNACIRLYKAMGGGWR